MKKSILFCFVLAAALVLSGFRNIQEAFPGHIFGAIDGEVKKEDKAVPDIYLEFLKGNGTAITADWFRVYDGYSGAAMIEIGKEYTLEQLHQIIAADHYDICQFKGETEYAVFDSENDQQMELAIRLNCVGFDMISDTTLIFKEIDGKLILCDSFDTWSRSQHTQYYYGIRKGSGSSGAGDHNYDESFIDKDGVKQIIYSCQSVMEDWMDAASEMALQNFNAIYQHEYPEDMNIHIYEIGDETYYAYEILGPAQKHQNIEKLEERQRELSKALISCFEEQGIRFLSLDEIEKRIENQKQKLGIAMEWCEEKELEWHKVSAALITE